MSKNMLDISRIPFPTPTERKVDQGVYDEAIAEGLSPLSARIISQRIKKGQYHVADLMNLSSQAIPSPKLMTDVEKAADRISDAVINGEKIGLACDFDVDGISSAAVMIKALNDHFSVPYSRIGIYISHRMREGYGFSHDVVARVLEDSILPSLIITADQGSSNGSSVDLIKSEYAKLGKDVDIIISDHHHIDPTNTPSNAYAFINPQRPDDTYPDKTICGCTVALLLFSGVRAELIKKGYLNKDARRMKDLLAYSTSATIADCVSMASPVNRSIVKEGLKEINNKSLPSWEALDTIVQEGELVSAETLAFGLAPKINACSRTGGDGLVAVKYYLADTKAEAERFLSMLSFVNKERQDIEARLLKEALQKAIELNDNGFQSFIIFLPQGHHGIHGIVASRIVEQFGKPVICLSPKSFAEDEIDQESAEKIIIELHKNKKGKNKIESLADLGKGTHEFIINDFQKISIDISNRKKVEYLLIKGKNEKLIKPKDVAKYFDKIKESFDGTSIDIDSLEKEYGSKFDVKAIMKELEDGIYPIEISKTQTIILKKYYPIVATRKRMASLTGSARSVECVSVYKCLENIDRDKKIFLGWGGHTMAAGLSLNVEHLDTLRSEFDKEVRSQLTKDLKPILYYDFMMKDNFKMDIPFIEQLEKIEPTGNGFPKPVFGMKAVVANIRITNETCILKLARQGRTLNSVIFKFKNKPISLVLEEGAEYIFYVSARKNFWKGRFFPSLIVEHAIKT
jgi:single-stranded-DNA-specific exonuclease RecJ